MMTMQLWTHLIMVLLISLQAKFKKKQRPNECSEDTWSMVQLTHQNSTHNSTDPNHHVYNIDTVTAENDCYYHCSKYHVCICNYYM